MTDKFSPYTIFIKNMSELFKNLPISFSSIYNCTRGHIEVIFCEDIKNYMLGSNQIIDYSKPNFESLSDSIYGFFSDDYTLNIMMNNNVIVSSKYTLTKYYFPFFKSGIYNKIINCSNLLEDKQKNLADIIIKGICSIFNFSSEESFIMQRKYYKMSTFQLLIINCLIFRIIESVELNFNRIKIIEY